MSVKPVKFRFLSYTPSKNVFIWTISKSQILKFSSTMVKTKLSKKEVKSIIGAFPKRISTFFSTMVKIEMKTELKIWEICKKMGLENLEKSDNPAK